MKISKQLHRLAVFQAAGCRIHLGIHVAVDHKKIQPTVVGEINKSRAPFYVGIAGLTGLGGPADISESLRARVSVEIVRLVGKICDVDIEQPAMFVIAKIDTHGSEFLAISA